MSSQSRPFIAFWILGLLSAVGASAEPTHHHLIGSYEGTYSLNFPCQANQTCGTDLTSYSRLVLLETGEAELLGSGRGMLATVTSPEIGPSFVFEGCEVDYEASTMNCLARDQGLPASIFAKYDSVSGQIVGTLRTSLSLTDLEFVASPLRCSRLMLLGEYKAASELGGTYLGTWAGDDSTIKVIIRDLGDNNFAGRLEFTNGVTISFPIYRGQIEEEYGIVTFLGEESGVLLKFFLVYHNGAWTGFSVSSEYGNYADLALKKVD
jgi:hypothetical protein